MNLKFVAPLGEIPTEFQIAETKKPDKTATDKPATTKTATTKATAEAETRRETHVKAGGRAQLNVKDLALTKDATDFEYKALVEHVLFKSKSDVKAVCAELAANLKAQGWTTDGSDMVTPDLLDPEAQTRGGHADDLREAGERRERSENVHRRPGVGLEGGRRKAEKGNRALRRSMIRKSAPERHAN